MGVARATPNSKPTTTPTGPTWPWTRQRRYAPSPHPSPNQANRHASTYADTTDSAAPFMSTYKQPDLHGWVYRQAQPRPNPTWPRLAIGVNLVMICII